MSKSPQSALNSQRRAELRDLRRRRKALASAALKEIAALGKQADKIAARHREVDQALARRAGILETRLGA